MANQPPINRNALVPVKHATAGTLPLGRGGVFTGAYSADGFALVDAPSGADAQINVVVYETTPDDATVGYALLVGQSLVPLRIGTTAVSIHDRLNIQNATGVWQTALAGAQNVYYEAVQNAAAGSLCWAMPISSRSI